jgi:hypothetical protein
MTPEVGEIKRSGFLWVLTFRDMVDKLMKNYHSQKTLNMTLPAMGMLWNPNDKNISRHSM